MRCHNVLRVLRVLRVHMKTMNDVMVNHVPNVYKYQRMLMWKAEGHDYL